jgi:hypothetical protein
MAYGAQAVQYFALPCVTGMAWDDGILDPAGTPSVRYDVFRRVNRDVAALGPRVRPFTCVGVYHTGPLTSGCRRFAAVRPGRDPSHLPLMRVEGDPVLLSFFQDARGGRGLMVVNRNAGRAARVRLELAGGWRANEIGRVDGLPLRDLGSAFAVNLEPGDGRFFCLTRPATGAP